MLDTTTVVWYTEISTPNTHDQHNMPFVIAGGGAGFRMGRWLRFTGDPSHQNLLVSLLNAHGVAAQTFGKPAYCTGPLPGLT
jgi:hypothetical protein